MSSLNELLSTLTRPKPGTVRHVVVMHDTGCPGLANASIADCRCHPVLVAGGPDESLEDLRRRVLRPRGGAA